MSCSHAVRGTLLAVAGGLAFVGGSVSGQPQQQGMMIVADDAGPSIMHFSGLPLHDLRQPDYVRDDLPLFRDRLVLSTAQYEALEVRLAEYLETFRALADRELPKPEPMVFRFGGGGGEHGDEHGNHTLGGLGGVFVEAMHEAGDEEGFDFEVDGEGGVAIAITAGAGMPTGGGETIDLDVTAGGPEGPSAAVKIAVAGGEDGEIPEAVRERLAEKAREMAEQIKAQLETMEEDGPGALRGIAGPESIEQRIQEMEELKAKAEDFRRAKAQLKEQFENGVQSDLEETQLERWPGLERVLTRKKTLPSGRLDGERTDLIELLDEVDLADEKSRQIAALVNGYELELHEALQRRNAFIPGAQQRVDEAMQNGEHDKALDLIDRATQLRLAVRRVNGQYAQAIANELGEETGSGFYDTYWQRSYPRVYGKNRGLRAFEKARQLDGIDEDTLMRILEIERPYRAELDTLNESLRHTIDRYQPLESRRMIERVQQMMNGDLSEPGNAFAFASSDDPIRAALGKRSELDGKYMKQLYDMLGPERAEQLPKIPSAQRQQPIVIFESAGDDDWN